MAMTMIVAVVVKTTATTRMTFFTMNCCRCIAYAKVQSRGCDVVNSFLIIRRRNVRQLSTALTEGGGKFRVIAVPSGNSLSPRNVSASASAQIVGDTANFSASKAVRTVDIKMKWNRNKRVLFQLKQNAKTESHSRYPLFMAWHANVIYWLWLAETAKNVSRLF